MDTQQSNTNHAISTSVLQQRKFFSEGRTHSLAFRRRQLLALHNAITKYEPKLLDALKKDLNKAAFESYETEIGIVLEEIAFALKHFTAWAKPKRRPTPLMHFPSSSYLCSEPYGCVMIMAPWNYPFLLTISPLIGSIAAGNCSIIKPSEYAPHTADVMEQLLHEVFPSYYVDVIRGGRKANQSLLNERFDYIFFTGSVNVGKLVMEAAAKNLTPVTLELGGKSPCIVDETANIKLAAKRIVWGKYLNAGQTCVAPDYVLVHKSVKDALIRAMKSYINKFYHYAGSLSSDYPRIVNRKHFERLCGLLESGHVICGGSPYPDTLQIEPTLMDQVTWDSDVMQEEIFGPILPILEYNDFENVLAQVRKREKPLALYLFTTDNMHEKMVLSTVSFGGGCINDTIIHLSNPHLPFGGVGNSGIGQYHGVESFRAFSHEKSIIRKSNMVDIPLRYPPYKNHLKLLKKFL